MNEGLSSTPEGLYNEHKLASSGVEEVQEEIKDRETHRKNYEITVELLGEFIRSNIERNLPVDQLESVRDDLLYLLENKDIQEDRREDDQVALRRAQQDYSANLWESQQHFRKNEEAYKQQAASDAQEAGVDVNYPPYKEKRQATPELLNQLSNKIDLKRDMLNDVANKIRMLKKDSSLDPGLEEVIYTDAQKYAIYANEQIYDMLNSEIRELEEHESRLLENFKKPQSPLPPIERSAPGPENLNN